MYLPILGTEIYAFGGHARAGKDTAAAILREIDPSATVTFAFSDAIAAYCRVSGGMTKRDPRLLQAVGYSMRQVTPSVWLDALYWRVDEVRPKRALVTGVRFPDEVHMLRDMGATLIWVDRARDDGSLVMATDRDPNFPTETALTRTDFDHLLINPDGQPDLFKLRVLALYDRLTRSAA